MKPSAKTAQCVKSVHPEKWGGGYTLVEMTVVAAIAALLSVMAVPAVQDFMINARLRSSANELLSDMAYARFEAIRRGERTCVCAADVGAGLVQPSCVGESAENWALGWVVFLDRADPSLACSTATTPEILRVRQPGDEQVFIRARSGGFPVGYQRFRATGNADGGRSFDIVFKDDWPLSPTARRYPSREVRVSGAGRVDCRDLKAAGPCKR